MAFAIRIAKLIIATSLSFLNQYESVAEESIMGPKQQWVDWDLELTAEPVVGLSGGKKPSSSSWIQQIKAGLTLGTGIGKEQSNWTELDHWQLKLELNQYTGNPSLGEQLGTIFPLQTLAIPVGTWITQAAFARKKGAKAFDWSMNAGVISVQDRLMGIPALDNYINYTINTPYNLSVTGFPINPLVAPGAQIGLHHQKLGSIDYGYYYLNQTNQIASALGVIPLTPKLQGTLQAIQWSINPFPQPKEQANTIERYPKSTNKATSIQNLPEPLIQIGGYFASTQLDVAETTNSGDGINNGIFGTVTFPVSFPLGKSHRLWLSGSLSLNPSNNPLSNYAAGGILSQGVIPERPQDVLALGITRSGFSKTITPEKSYEGAIEVNYTIQLTDSLQIQPLMQWIINPKGTGMIPAIWAAGTQINLSL